MRILFDSSRPFAIIAAVILGCLLSVDDAVAEKTKFPYPATIFKDAVEIHSGPGSRFYPTGKLKKNDVVMVHRHDPGGWYMVAPPAGSFSLVRAEYVKRQGPKQGVITENNVIVRVGSQLGDHHEVEQRRLMKGDRVAILSESMLSDQGRNVPMLRIQPPAGEFRWIKGDYIVPSDPKMRKVHDSNPYTVPSNGVEINQQPPQAKPNNTPDFTYPVAGKDRTPKRHSPTNWDSKTAVVDSSLDPQTLERDRAILDALDRNFRNMIQQDIATWNLRDLLHDYRKLQKATTVPPIVSQIDLRLQAMERYGKIKADYDDLVQLTSGTEQRDAQLLSLQQQTQTATAPSDDFGWERKGDFEDNQFAELPEQQGFLPDLGPDSSASTPPTQMPPVRSPAPWGPNTSASQIPNQQRPQFAGAGIIKKVGGSPGQTPEYVLVTPDDQLLAYLVPGPRINLDTALGYSAGVIGNRQHSPQLQADVINVTGVTPVQLQNPR